jgi:hypothetical protein
VGRWATAGFARDSEWDRVTKGRVGRSAKNSSNRRDARGRQRSASSADATYGLTEAAIHKAELYFFGGRGEILKLSDENDDLEIISTARSGSFINAISFGDYLVAFGAGGMITALPTDVPELEYVNSTFTSGYLDPIVFHESLLFFNSYGAIIQLRGLNESDVIHLYSGAGREPLARFVHQDSLYELLIVMKSSK